MNMEVKTDDIGMKSSGGDQKLTFMNSELAVKVWLGGFVSSTI